MSNEFIFNKKASEQKMETQIGIIKEVIKEYDFAEYGTDAKRFFLNAMDRLDETLYWVKKGICKSERFD